MAAEPQESVEYREHLREMVASSKRHPRRKAARSLRAILWNL